MLVAGEEISSGRGDRPADVFQFAAEGFRFSEAWFYLESSGFQKDGEALHEVALGDVVAVDAEIFAFA